MQVSGRQNVGGDGVVREDRLDHARRLEAETSSDMS